MKLFLFISSLLLLIGCANNLEENNSQKETVSISTIDNINQSPILSIHLQAYGSLNDDIINYVYKELKKIYPKVDLLKTKPLPKEAYYKARNRYKADTIIAIQKNNTPENELTVGLTEKDISTTKDSYSDWGIMGLGYQPGRACVASTFRVSKTNTKQQYFKVVIHEIGHTQGLPHCANKACIMTDAEGKNKTDNEKGFCPKCYAVLSKKGFLLEKFKL